MKQNLKQIQNYLKNKNICLLGNARSVLKKPKNIDDFEIVCRMNRGFPRKKYEKYIGNKTDILFLSCKMRKSIIKSTFNPKYIMWMTPKSYLATKGVKKIAFHYSPKDWKNLRSKLPKRPTTGCMAIDFLLKYIDFKKLTIYGFDFYKTGTWYHTIGCHYVHDAKSEKKLILSMIKDKPNVELIIE